MTKQDFIGEIISYVKANSHKTNKIKYINRLLNPEVKGIIAQNFEPLLNYVIADCFEFYSGYIPTMDDIYELILIRLVAYYDNKLNNDNKEETFKYSPLLLSIIGRCVGDEE